jgi:hypothetical protein
MRLADDNPWSWEIDENTLICDQRGWNEGTEEEINELMEQFSELGSDPEITQSITLLDPDIKLDSERQAVIEQNAPLYDRLGIKKQALVSDGIAGMALKSLVDTPDGFEIDSFDTKEAAVAWCQD